MKKKHFDWEHVFAHIWDRPDADGLWEGDAATLAAEFHVAEEEANDTLGELCDRGFIERLVPGKYAIVKWPERDEAGEDELAL